MRLLQRITSATFDAQNSPRRTTVGYGFLCLFFAQSIIAYGQQSGQQYEQSLEQVSREIREITGELNENKKLLKNEQDKLSEVEQNLAELRREQAAALQQKQQHREALDELEQQLAALAGSQQDSRKAIEDLIVHRYKAGNPNYLKLLLNQENPFAAGRLSHYYHYFSEAQRQKLDELSAQLEDVRALQQEASERTAELAQTEQKLQAQSQSLQSLAQQRSKRVASLDQEVLAGTTKLEQLQADRARLNTLIQQIAEQARKLRELERQREEAARQAAAASSESRPVSRPKRQPVAGGFRKQKGRLAPPVNSALAYGYGSRLAASGMPAQGNFYDTKNNQIVSAVFRGNVLFADYLKGYGLLLIIDHGDDHISLYGHNEVLYKRVGDAVTTGEAIAKSGVSGGLKQPGLYFEIRQNAVPVDPNTWLSD